jgi:hypothetical protein
MYATATNEQAHLLRNRNALRDKIVEEKMARLIDDGHALLHDKDLELTSEGTALYKK